MRLSDLHECFVSFETEKLEGCRMVYLNETLAGRMSSKTILDAYSFAVRSDSMPDQNQSTIKIFMAERYGGEGILSNGGGGRCGFDGVWQLKGLGPNQLVGIDVDAEHGDGYLSLNTAIYESIWSEIVNVTLPFGAIRTVAILDTGRKYDERGIPVRRGLMIRQPVVRPAHFIRATYFKEKQQDRLCEDAQRVKAVIARLVNFLPNTCGDLETKKISVRLKYGFFELAARFAEQFAAARAKNIIHFNVSESNLSLDGAWLDLSGTRLFTENIGIDKVDIDKFNNEHLPALRSVHSLCYYLSKYAVISTKESNDLFKSTNEHFTEVYTEKLRLYQVAQAGFPLWTLNKIIESPELTEFSSVLFKLMNLNNFTVYPITLKGGWCGYERWTARLFRELLSSKMNSENANLSWLNIDTTEIDQIVRRYNELLDLASKTADENGITLHNFYRTMLINVTRLNCSHSVLHNLKKKIQHIEAMSPNYHRTFYRELANDAVLAATLHLDNNNKLRTPFWLSKTLSIWFDPTCEIFTLEADKIYSLSPENLITIGEHQPDVSMALSFYGTEWIRLNERAL